MFQLTSTTMLTKSAPASRIRRKPFAPVFFAIVIRVFLLAPKVKFKPIFLLPCCRFHSGEISVFSVASPIITKDDGVAFMAFDNSNAYIRYRGVFSNHQDASVPVAAVLTINSLRSRMSWRAGSPTVLERSPVPFVRERRLDIFTDLYNVEVL